jgi:hypothetical protein
MSMQERIVWIAVVLVLAISLIATGLDSPDDKNITKNPIRHPDSTVAEEPISIPSRVHYRTGNGFNVMVPLGADYFTVGMEGQNVSMEVMMEEGSLEGKGKLLDGPDDWKVMIHEGWDSDPETKQMGNSSRTFFKDYGHYYLKAIQYDYTGGKYDVVFEDMLKEIIPTEHYTIPSR